MNWENASLLSILPRRGRIDRARARPGGTPLGGSAGLVFSGGPIEPGFLGDALFSSCRSGISKTNVCHFVTFAVETPAPMGPISKTNVCHFVTFSVERPAPMGPISKNKCLSFRYISSGNTGPNGDQFPKQMFVISLHLQWKHRPQWGPISKNKCLSFRYISSGNTGPNGTNFQEISKTNVCHFVTFLVETPAPMGPISRKCS